MARLILALSAALALALPAHAAKTAKSQERSDSRVTCKDGSLSRAGKGACSHHGGIGAPSGTSRSRKDSAKVSARGNGAISDKQEQAEDVRQERQNSGTDAAKSGGFWSRMAGRSARPPERTSQKPAPGSSPTARCTDGSISYSKQRSG